MPILKYEHCGTRWQASEEHFDGDLCFTCKQHVKPEPIEERDERPFCVLKVEACSLYMSGRCGLAAECPHQRKELPCQKEK